MNESRFRIVIALAASLVGTSPVAAGTEVRVFGWTTPTTECPDSTVDELDTDVISEWYDEMEDQGWDKGGMSVDKMSPDAFCDRDVSGSSCKDKKTDGADAIVVNAHGGVSETYEGDGEWTPYFNLLAPKQSSIPDVECDINAPEAPMHFGDLDLEFLHFLSCESAQDEVLPYLTQHFADPIDSEDPDASNYGRRMHLWTGFHGIHLSHSRTDTFARRFAQDGHDVAIADAWIDNFYESSLSYTDEDDGYDEGENCPVLLTVDDRTSDCEDRAAGEKYTDRTAYGDPSGTAMWCGQAVENCDPVYDDPFDP